MSVTSRIRAAWNVFKMGNPQLKTPFELGIGTSYHPDQYKLPYGVERSIVNSIYNQISNDVAAIPIAHVRLDDNKRYKETIDSSLNRCFNLEANIDQTGRAFVQDFAMSLCDEGVVALVPTTGYSMGIDGVILPEQMRVGKILEWFPKHIKVQVYNEAIGDKEEVYILKRQCGIVENPLYSVMNEPNSMLQRLIRKLALLDRLDDLSASDKINLLVKLPYPLKTPEKRKQANMRMKEIELQLANNKHGIAYIDAAEQVIQLNRPAENNLLTQIEYLTNTVYNQLGMSASIFDGTADEATKLNYQNRSVIPIVDALVGELRRKFLTSTARTQGQSIMYFQNPFKYVPVSALADIGDKLTRNEILSSNEMRGIIGYKPVEDPKADELRNKNLNPGENQESPLVSKDTPPDEKQL